MRYLDYPLAVTVGMFMAGSLSGAACVTYVPNFRIFVLQLVQARMLGPVSFALTNGGQFAVFILVFANNSALAFLSFLYPFLIATVHWVPDLSISRRILLLTSFTLLTAFVVGFFGFGGILAVEWAMNGSRGILGVLAKSWLHGPIELFCILLCVSEPLRLAGWADAPHVVNDLRMDLRILLFGLLGLIVAGAIEVYSVV